MSTVEVTDTASGRDPQSRLLATGWLRAIAGPTLPAEPADPAAKAAGYRYDAAAVIVGVLAIGFWVLIKVAGFGVWLPAGERLALSVLGVSTGGIAFVVVSRLAKKKSALLTTVGALFALAITIVAYMVYQGFTNRSLQTYQFDRSLWSQFETPDPARPDRMRVVVPWFLDLEGSRILLPRQWPDKCTKHFEGIHEVFVDPMNHGAVPTDEARRLGLAWSMQYEPLKIINYLQFECAGEMRETRWNLYMGYLVLMMAYGIFAGFMVSPMDHLLEMTLERLSSLDRI